MQSYDTSTAAGKLREEFGREFDASQKLTTAIDIQAQAKADLARKNQELWDSADKLITQEEAQVNAGFALQEAQMAVAGSSDKVAEAQAAYSAAVKKYGADSTEARDAQRAYQRELIDQEKDYYAVAAAARRLQEDTDVAATGQKDATKETEVYIDTLQAEANSLAPDSPLRKNLQDYIDKLKNEIPADITTRFHLSFDSGGTGSHAGGHGIQAYAAGGRPQVGVPSWVGEHGPEIWTPDQPGTITPTGGTPPAPAGSSDIHVHGPLVQADTNADAHDIAVDASWELRKMRRAF